MKTITIGRSYPLRLRFITQPEEAPPANRAERRAEERRITSQYSAGKYFNCHERTIRNWVQQGFVPGYKLGKSVLVDLDEIEAALLVNSRMRDGRRPIYGEKATILPLPVTGVNS